MGLRRMDSSEFRCNSEEGLHGKDPSDLEWKYAIHMGSDLELDSHRMLDSRLLM